jgi:hypothetical protein
MNKQPITLEQLEALAQCADLYSARLAFCRDKNNPRDHIPASGVFLELGGHYFLLTAGHVAQLAQKYGDPYVSVAKYWHSFRPKVVLSRFELRGSEDKGFLELAPSDANMIESRDKIFASSARILSVSSTNLGEEDLFVFLFGFPAYYAQEFNKSILIISKILGQERPSRLPKADHDNYIDLRIDRDKMDWTDGNLFKRQPPGKLGGASGSGIWAIVLDGFSPENIRLIGIATYHSHEKWAEGDLNLGFVRATRICKILDLIRDAYPQLETDIYNICSEKTMSLP